MRTVHEARHRVGLSCVYLFLSLADASATGLSQDEPLGDPPPIEWRREYGEPGHDTGVRVVRETADGGFILGGGTTASPRGTPLYPHLIKTDPAGLLEWMTTFASPEAIPRQFRRRSDERKPECQGTGAQPNLASNRFRNGSVSAISGNRTSACLPARRHWAIASK